MQSDPVKDFIASLPPSTVNNSRAFAARVYEKSKKERFGGYWTNVFEELSGLPSDRTPYDCGMAMEEKYNTHE